MHESNPCTHYILHPLPKTPSHKITPLNPSIYEVHPLKATPLCPACLNSEVFHHSPLFSPLLTTLGGSNLEWGAIWRAAHEALQLPGIATTLFVIAMVGGVVVVLAGRNLPPTSLQVATYPGVLSQPSRIAIPALTPNQVGNRRSPTLPKRALDLTIFLPVQPCLLLGSAAKFYA